MLLVLDNYDSFTYNLVQMFQVIGENVHVWSSPEVTFNGLKLKRGQDYRLGHVARLNGTNLTVWIRCQDTEFLLIVVSDIETLSD